MNVLTQALIETFATGVHGSRVDTSSTTDFPDGQRIDTAGQLKSRDTGSTVGYFRYMEARPKIPLAYLDNEGESGFIPAQPNVVLLKVDGKPYRLTWEERKQS